MLNEIKIPPIGEVVKSTFQHKWGTPRQGQLTPDATAEIRMQIRLCFPVGVRVAVIWAAHLNSAKFNPLKGKIKPPKKGGTVGVFATRGVHRPSSVGLSFCTVSGILGNLLLLSGGDMIEGTPILAIHLASTVTPDSIQHEIVRCPEWTNVSRSDIRWSIGAFACTHLIERATGVRIAHLVTEILSQDPRSVHSIRKHQDPIYQVEIRARSSQVHVIYRHRDGGVEVLFVTCQPLVPEHRGRTEQWLERLLEKLQYS